MLEKPDIQDEKIIACLQDEYDIEVDQIGFLPLGADVNTAVYRVVTVEGIPYFLKLRNGFFDPTSVALPKFLSDQGIAQIIPPIGIKTGRLWGNLDTYKTILYPYIEGRNGYEVVLSGRHWAELGTALKKIHTLKIPAELACRIRRETYTAKWREAVRAFLARVENEAFEEPTAAELAAFLNSKRAEVFDLVRRAGRLARVLQAQHLEPVVCHSDIHAGNVLIGSSGALYIVDWDEPIRAPKERDLMYIGGGLMASGRSPQEEENLFYKTYGHTQLNQIALAYYRYERIIQDIAAYCEELLLTDEGGEDRAQSLRYLKSNFLPGGTIEIAYESDKNDWSG
jgi:spectinomycin phosphotransferase